MCASQALPDRTAGLSSCHVCTSRTWALSRDLTAECFFHGSTQLCDFSSWLLAMFSGHCKAEGFMETELLRKCAPVRGCRSALNAVRTMVRGQPPPHSASQAFKGIISGPEGPGSYALPEPIQQGAHRAGEEVGLRSSWRCHSPPWSVQGWGFESRKRVEVSPMRAHIHP